MCCVETDCVVECVVLGIRYELREVEKDDLLEALERANHDPDVHGIIVYYPCFGTFPSFYGGSMDDFLRDSISIKKDVEVRFYLFLYWLCC